jgi:nitroreductase
LLKEAINPGENQLIFGIVPLGYPKPGFQKIFMKKRKSLEEIVDFL